MTPAWHDLSLPERVHIVREALVAVRAGLTLPAPTRVVADRISRIIGIDSRDVGSLLVRFCTQGNAKPGPSIKRYGRKMQRWEWQPAEIAGQALDDLIA